TKSNAAGNHWPCPTKYSENVAPTPNNVQAIRNCLRRPPLSPMAPCTRPRAATATGAERGREQRDGEARGRVGIAEARGRLGGGDAGAPELLEEHGEEAGHDRSGESRVGPGVEAPCEDWFVFEEFAHGTGVWGGPAPFAKKWGVSP